MYKLRCRNPCSYINFSFFHDVFQNQVISLSLLSCKPFHHVQVLMFLPYNHAMYYLVPSKIHHLANSSSKMWFSENRTSHIPDSWFIASCFVLLSSFIAHLILLCLLLPCITDAEWPSQLIHPTNTYRSWFCMFHQHKAFTHLNPPACPATPIERGHWIGRKRRLGAFPLATCYTVAREQFVMGSSR